MKKTVLLDAGGVILDETDYERTVSQVVTEFVIEHKPEYSKEDYWRDTNEAVRNLETSTPSCVLRKNIDGYNDEIEQEFRRRRKKARPPLKLMDGIVGELKALGKDYNLVLAGQYGADVYDLLDGAGVGELFANRLSQDDFNITKPDPAYYQQIIDRADVKAEDCVMVGDRIDKDVIPAKKLGMKAIFVKSGIYKHQQPRSAKEEPDLVLESVVGLADAIRKLMQ